MHGVKPTAFHALQQEDGKTPAGRIDRDTDARGAPTDDDDVPRSGASIYAAQHRLPIHLLLSLVPAL